MASVLTEIVIDCADPMRVGRFWAEALGWPLQEEERGFCWASATGGYDARPFLVFVPVPEGKTVKNRVHLDVSPSGCEADEEAERLVGLGATRVDIGQGEVPWIVMADPEGNEFCVLRRRVD